MVHRSSYSPEFREEAVQFALRSKRPIAETARELNMNSETLRVWVRNHEREQGADTAAAPEPLATSERARLRGLERRNRELEMEVSFLKEAATYFVKDAE